MKRILASDIESTPNAFIWSFYIPRVSYVSRKSDLSHVSIRGCINGAPLSRIPVRQAFPEPFLSFMLR